MLLRPGLEAVQQGATAQDAMAPDVSQESTRTQRCAMTVLVARLIVNQDNERTVTYER